MAHEYGPSRWSVYYMGEYLLTDGDEPWEPSEPEGTATLWRYMSFAKFCSLLDSEALFFALTGDMVDKYEGFICPPRPREHGDTHRQAEQDAYELLSSLARKTLVSCWTESEHESNLMWESYAGSEGVAIRTTFQRLQDSIRLVGEPPVTFGRVEYVDYSQGEVPRLGLSPLFHKRLEYRGEGEVRAVLPAPSPKNWFTGSPVVVAPDFSLDPDVDEQRGRYVPVNLEILVEKIVLSPNAKPWFAEVVQSAIRNSAVKARVTRSSME